MFYNIRIITFPVVIAFLVAAGATLGAIYTNKFFHLVPPCTISQWFGETTKPYDRGLSWYERLQWRIVDGDTIHCERRNLRMLGYDTPETRARGLTKEKIWGQVATRRFVELLRQTKWWTEFTGDDDGRSRMIVRLHNEGPSIPKMLIDEGLARPLSKGQKRPDWCRLIARNPSVIERLETEMPYGPNCPN